MDDIERAIEDGVNAFKALVKDGRFVPGAGAAEINVAAKVLIILLLFFFISSREPSWIFVPRNLCLLEFR